MKLKFPFEGNTLGSLLLTAGVVCCILLFSALGYFYVYLPAVTHHGESITVPDLKGMKLEELNEFLTKHDLRYAIDDSTYTEDFPPLSVLRQFPKEGSKVKEGRVIYVSVNRVSPPTMPLTDLTNISLTSADIIIKTNQLRRGRVSYRPHPWLNYVVEMRINGKPVTAGTQVRKGTVVDLIVGDGRGRSSFTVGSLVGDTYERALFKLDGWNLLLGNVKIPEGVDTTGIQPIVFKQHPEAGDSVSVGDAITLWIGPRGYKEAPEDIDVNKP